MTRTIPLRERLIRHVSVDENGCWIWTGATWPNGYGLLGLATTPKTTVLTHRLSYELHVGPIPEGLVIDHLCRVPLCCNPLHLEAVTQRINMLRGTAPAAARARQDACIHGHRFDEANTAIRSNGTRRCRQCTNDRAARKRDALRPDRRRLPSRKPAWAAL